ncbi:MAG: MBOAT family protein [Candidatus Cloacimonetes bacterium]|nr:MBOAT family protein [Candidatus Cloacimonadota bacterium]
MLFNSIEFLIFFPIVCLIYFIIPHKVRWAFLLVASYYFYMSWKASYAILLFGVTTVNYLGGLAIANSKNKETKKWILIFTIILSLSGLYYYKYFNFIGNTINAILNNLGIGISIPFLDLILPVGISFFTFQALSYTIDIYKGQMKCETNFGIFALFVSFFPQLVAGPIERATHLLPQFYEKHKWNDKNAVVGIRLMLWGMFKKVVVADRLALYVNAVFNNYQKHSGLSYILASILFAFQIYCDFSGYSDIARGSARVMGFDLMVNFRFPYLSENVTKFWQRNHISLTTWLKDYIYFPLVETNPTVLRMCVLIFITFLLSGLWHGADWTFVIWGIWQAVFLIYDILMRKKRKRMEKWFKERKLLNLSLGFRYLVTFAIICLGAIFFRASDVKQGWAILKGILSLKEGSLFIDAATLSYSFIALILLLFIEANNTIDFNDFIMRQKTLSKWSLYYIIIISIIVLGVFDNSAFIYFQF